LAGPWTTANPLPTVQVAGTPPNVDTWYPPTVNNPLPVVVVTRAATTNEFVEAALIEDAPQDGRLYARCNGAWVPIGVQE
jgi:hypothetical protein